MSDTEEQQNKRLIPPIQCEWEGCTNDTYGGYLAHCQKHYRLNRKAGQPTRYRADKPKPSYRYHNKATGYWILRRPGHALANKQGYVYEHRHVAFSKYGPGEQACHWCERTLEWSEVDVDHLDWDRANNSADNLVTSCQGCNAARYKPDETPEPIAQSSNKLMALARSFRD